MNLGNALVRFGKGVSDPAWLEEAIIAFHKALQELTRARVPLDWARTQMNLGNALRALGERESGTARLEEAVSAYREAVHVLTRARLPLEWAMTQFNLALAYRAHFDKSGEPCHLDNALEVIDGALGEFREAEADFYIEEAERLRENIFAAKREL